MFQQLRRMLAVVLDVIFLFPFVFWLSVIAYNESVHWVSTNVDALEFVLFVNEYSLGLYFVFLFPLIYILYETIGYLLFHRTIGQYFMQISLQKFNTTTVIFRAFFGISLHIVSIGLFSLVNAAAGLLTGRTIIDRLSRSQPEMSEAIITHPTMKLLSLLGGVALAGGFTMYVHNTVTNKCFDITCIKEVILKDTIEQKILEQQLTMRIENQQAISLSQWEYSNLAEIFFLPEELANVPTKNYTYDVFEVSFTEDLQVYSQVYQEWLQIAADEPWQFILAKSKTGLQPWQLYIRDFSRDQFVPIRVVVTSINQNSYQWEVNVSPINNANMQWTLKLIHDLGSTTQITLEK
ncbi:MAG: hypothetical protein ACRCWD_04145 [Culicoidibacterales bacterium]